MLDDLADQAAAAVALLGAHRTFEEARAALREAGMLRARQRLVDALANIGTAQTGVREMGNVAAVLKDRAAQVASDVEWELDSRFVSEGAKTFLVTGEERKPMTADERKAWKQAEARKQPAVVEAGDVVREADRLHAEARDALTHAELAFRAARADLDAAVATVQILAASIRKEVTP